LNSAGQNTGPDEEGIVTGRERDIPPDIPLSEYRPR